MTLISRSLLVFDVYLSLLAGNKNHTMFVCLFVIAVGRRHLPMQREYKTAELEVDGPKVTRGGGYAQLLKRCM